MQDKIDWYDLDYLLNGSQPTLGNLLEYMQIGGKCRKCGTISPLNRYELASKYGRDQYINGLKYKLRCKACKNKGDNSFVVAKMPR